MMHCHITRDCLIIIFLSETEPQGVFVLDGESNEPQTDFPQPISQKLYLVRFRNELFFNGNIGTKKNKTFLYLDCDKKLRKLSFFSIKSYLNVVSCVVH